MIEPQQADVVAQSAGTPVPRKPWPIALGITIALLLTVGLVWALVQNGQQRAAAERAKSVRAAARDADAILEKVFASLATRDRLWASPDDVDLGEVKSNVEFTISSLKDIRGEQLPGVRRAVKGCGSAEVERRYNAVADSLDSVLASSAAGLERGSKRVALYTVVQDADDEVERGEHLIDESVKAGNARSYGTATKKAKEARAAFAKAVSLLEQALKQERAADIRTGLAVAKEAVILADMQIELYEMGSDASVSRYNAQVTRTNKQRDAVAAAEVGNSRLEAGMRLWSEMQDLAGDFVNRTAPAKALWEEAKTYAAREAG